MGFSSTLWLSQWEPITAHLWTGAITREYCYPIVLKRHSYNIHWMSKTLRTPSTVVSSWLDVLWVVGYSWYTWEIVECEKPSSVAVLDTLKTDAPGTCYHTPFKGTSIFCLAHSPSEWNTYTIHVSIVSRLKNPSLHVSSPSSTLIWSGFSKWRQ